MTEVEIERARESLPVRTISKSKTLRRLARRMGRDLKNYTPRVARPISPYRFAAEHLFLVLLTLPLLAVGPILALMMHPVFLSLMAIPAIGFALPWLRLRSMIGDRRRAVDGELPFFAVHATIAQSAGLNLYESLTSTIGQGVFKRVEEDAEFLKRNVQVLGRSPLAALEELGRNHPHRGMRTLLLGYTSEYRAGGDLEGYLEGKADEYLRETRRRWEKYVRDVGTIAEVIIVLLFIVPVLTLVATFFSPDIATSLGAGFLILGIPVILAFSFMTVRSSQPKDYSKFHGNVYLPIVTAPITAYFLLELMPVWGAISAAAGVAFLAYGASVYLQRWKALREEESLPQFLRDVTEYRKMDWPLKKTVETLREEEKYTPEFNSLLSHVVKQVRLGRTFSEVETPTRSWLVKLGFFHLGQVAETGGFTAKSMELLTDFTTRVSEARSETRSSLQIYRWLSVAAPFLLAVVVGSLLAMMGAFELPEVVGGAPFATGIPALEFEIPPIFESLSAAIIALSSMGMAFLTSYASDFTWKNTFWVGLNAFLVASAITLMPLIKDFVGGLMGI